MWSIPEDFRGEIFSRWGAIQIFVYLYRLPFTYVSYDNRIVFLTAAFWRISHVVSWRTYVECCVGGGRRRGWRWRRRRSRTCRQTYDSWPTSVITFATRSTTSQSDLSAVRSALVAYYIRCGSHHSIAYRVSTIVPSYTVASDDILVVGQSCNNRPRLFLADSLSDGMTLSTDALKLLFSEEWGLVFT